MEPRVATGLDRVLRDPGTRRALVGNGARIGLLTNDGASRPPPRLRLREGGIIPARIFSPEHGLSATHPDGQAVEDGRDGSPGPPVTSLYGARWAPPLPQLRELDLVLVDLQDVGARFYTFLWTLSHMMEACGEAGTPIRILDRPNPLGGLPEWVEGPLPDPGLRPHFLARWPIPIRHSLTLGEMALLLRGETGSAVDLEVVPMEGWKRSFLWTDTGLPFPSPSPGIPSFQAALLYPGLAFLEATNLREGRGTPLSFRWLGAPWMDPGPFAEAVNALGLPGVRAHARILPQGGSRCPGVALDVTDPREVRPVALGLRILALLGTLCSSDFSWSPYPTAANPEGRDHLLLLTGSARLVESLQRSPGEWVGADLEVWTRPPGWWDRARPYLIYD